MRALAHQVDTESSRLWLHRGAPLAMTRAHRHDDVEFNLVLSGSLTYTFWGEPLSVEGGELAVFWGAAPHLLHPDATPGATEGVWVHIPLATVLGWGLPADQLARLLQPAPVVLPIRAISSGAAATMAGWVGDVDHGVDLTTVLLEAQALLRRALRFATQRLEVSESDPPVPASLVRTTQPAKASAMARYITENFRDAVTTADVAASVHLSSGHASTLFTRSLGVSIGTFLQRCRIAEAQRLLISSEADVVDIAYGVGYASMSSFYEQFTRICGISPAAYRRRLAASEGSSTGA